MAEVFKKYGVAANIIFGNIEFLKGVPLGKLGVTLTGETAHIEKALTFIKENGVSVEVV